MAKKRYRMPTAKEGELLVKYGRDDVGDLDLLFCYPDNDCGMKRDSRILMQAFHVNAVHEGRSLIKELEARGYDIETLTFSIKKKNISKVNA